PLLAFAALLDAKTAEVQATPRRQTAPLPPLSPLSSNPHFPASPRTRCECPRDLFQIPRPHRKNTLSECSLALSHHPRLVCALLRPSAWFRWSGSRSPAPGTPSPAARCR